MGGGFGGVGGQEDEGDDEEGPREATSLESAAHDSL